MESDNELKIVLNDWLNMGLAVGEYNLDNVKLLNRYYKCLNVVVDYMEE